MKTTTLIIGIVVSLIIGGSVGYFSGKSASNNSAQSKELQDSISMMKKQVTSIEEMGDMMRSGGIMMQEMGAKYQDEGATSKGKDLQAIGEKYIKESEKAVKSDASMKQIMD